ncbi:hypothetical protein DFH29DRAFT_1007504 [Suillus ampliporus]|nr:hypothetical protein DFH29DRAFT_1007504 [Suillus ampliporus]
MQLGAWIDLPSFGSTGKAAAICNCYDVEECILDPGPEESCEDEGDEGDDEELIEQELNHTCVTTNYFSKAKKADTASRGPGSHPPQMFTLVIQHIHLNYSPTRTGMQIDDVADEFKYRISVTLFVNFLANMTQGAEMRFMELGFQEDR